MSDGKFEVLVHAVGELAPAIGAVNTGYTKFRGEQNLWFCFAEAGFVRLMQAAKTAAFISPNYG